MRRQARTEDVSSASTGHAATWGESAPSLSVVIAAYNAAPFLAQALDSVYAQTLMPAEVIVVDDGSTDGTVDVARGYRPSEERRQAYLSFVQRLLPAEEIPAPASSASVAELRVLSQENRGPAAARNRGVETARGDWVAFLDADDLWLPWTADVFIRCTSEPGVVAVFGDGVNFDERGVQTPARGEAGCSPPGRCDNPVVLLAKENPILTGALCVRKNAFFDVGGFEEAFRYAEDHHLWLRLALCGAFYHVPRPVLLRRRHGGSLSSAQHRFYEAGVKVAQSVAGRYGKQLRRAGVSPRGLVDEAWRRLANYYRWSGRFVRAVTTWLCWQVDRCRWTA